MRIRLITTAFCVFTAVICTDPCWATGLLVNPGFETVAYTGGAGDWPTDAGYWRGDTSEIVMNQQGISPLEGARMLRFVYASGSPKHYSASEIIQLVDLTPIDSMMLSGNAVAVLSAQFNRVDHDNETDTKFGVALRAYAGDPTTHLGQMDVSELAMERSTVLTDDDLLTWEDARVELLLPAATDFLAVRVHATENIRNDLTGQEFDGHYVDAVVLDIHVIPEPLTIAGVSLGSLAVLEYFRRRLFFLRRLSSGNQGS